MLYVHTGIVHIVYIILLCTGSLDRSTLLVWWDHVWWPHHGWLGSQIMQDVPGWIHEARTGQCDIKYVSYTYIHLHLLNWVYNDNVVVITSSSSPTQCGPYQMPGRLPPAASVLSQWRDVCRWQEDVCLRLCDYNKACMHVHTSHTLDEDREVETSCYTVLCDSCLWQHHEVLDYSNPTLILQLQ